MIAAPGSRRVRAAALTVLLLLAAGAVRAQSFPSKPIRLVLGFPPAATTDITARMIGNAMSATLGQPIVVENRPGANTLIATKAVADAAPDGHTLGYVSGTIASGPATVKNWDVDPLRQFAPIAQAVSFPIGFAINPKKHDVRTLAEFIAVAKANPGKLNMAVIGANGSDDIIIKILMRAAGAKVVHVSYKGGAATTQALLSGEADGYMSSANNAKPHVLAGNMRVLGFQGATRFRTMPEVPTFEELGYPGLRWTNWFGFVAPAGTPKEVLAKLHGAIAVAMKSASIEKPLTEVGLDVVASTPEEFAKLIRTDLAMYRKLVADGVVAPE